MLDTLARSSDGPCKLRRLQTQRKVWIRSRAARGVRTCRESADERRPTLRLQKLALKYCRALTRSGTPERVEDAPSK